MTEEKIRENRLRRMAERRGLALRKSRRRDSGALDFGAYWLIDPRTKAVVSGGDWGMSLDAVEQALTSAAGFALAGIQDAKRDLQARREREGRRS